MVGGRSIFTVRCHRQQGRMGETDRIVLSQKYQICNSGATSYCARCGKLCVCVRERERERENGHTPGAAPQWTDTHTDLNSRLAGSRFIKIRENKRQGRKE